MKRDLKELFKNTPTNKIFLSIDEYLDRYSTHDFVQKFNNMSELEKDVLSFSTKLPNRILFCVMLPNRDLV